jgi:hypothetical protein
MNKETSDLKVVKYFTIPIVNAREWDWRDYLLFVIESLYTTVFPFCAGMLLVQRQELIWLLMLILPIYFKFSVERKFTQKTKKLFIK